MESGKSPKRGSIEQLEETYALAAKQCGVTLWMFDFASRTIFDLHNATRIKVFDGVGVIAHVPEVFVQSDSSLHPEDMPAFLEMFDALFAGAKTAKSIGRWWNEDHSVLWWYEIAYTTIFDGEGKPFQAIGTAIDITERIRLEERYNEEIEWRKIHNRDVIGSFKMNLTQNTCEDGQSDIAAIRNFQGDGTVDGFFKREYATHMDAGELAEYKKIFNRKSLLKAYRMGKSSFVQEAYVNFGGNKILWIQIELDLFQNPKSGDTEAYIYALDIDRKKTAQALMDAVVNMDYDFLGLLDAATDSYTIFATTSGQTALPPFYSSDYKTEVAQFARDFILEEDIAQSIHDMSYENLFEQLEKQPVFTTYCRVHEPDGHIGRKKFNLPISIKPARESSSRAAILPRSMTGNSRKTRR